MWSEVTLSCMAWASGSFDEVKAPLHRSGSPIRRASWAAANEPSAASGVPKVGEPVFRFTVVRKLPNTAGEPGRSSWPSATPTMTSAIDCATAPAIDTGPVAPPRMNGTTTGHWFARA